MHELYNTIKTKIAKTISQIIIAPVPKHEGKTEKRISIEHAVGDFLKVQYYPKKTYGVRYIYQGQAGSDQIFDILQSGKPCLVARFGRTEMTAVYAFLKYKHKMHKYPQAKLDNLGLLSGFFPGSHDALIRFCCEQLEVLQHVDILACWNLYEEEQLCSQFARNARLIDLITSIPIWFDNPWSRYLQGKKVLVIHPFDATIKSQYQKRALLFANELVLPEFELATIKAVQGLADSKDSLPYANWFEALESMYRKIDAADFDIALIGAGAYGMFLGAYCKKLGKQAVHMGGGTQLLFGITGARYDEGTWLQTNEHWVRPSVDERPKGYEKIENGCYW